MCTWAWDQSSIFRSEDGGTGAEWGQYGTRRNSCALARSNVVLVRDDKLPIKNVLGTLSSALRKKIAAAQRARMGTGQGGAESHGWLIGEAYWDATKRTDPLKFDE